VATIPHCGKANGGKERKKMETRALITKKDEERGGSPSPLTIAEGNKTMFNAKERSYNQKNHVRSPSAEKRKGNKGCTDKKKECIPK